MNERRKDSIIIVMKNLHWVIVVLPKNYVLDAKALEEKIILRMQWKILKKRQTNPMKLFLKFPTMRSMGLIVHRL